CPTRGSARVQAKSRQRRRSCLHHTSMTPLEITRPRRSRIASSVTSRTAKSELEISGVGVHTPTFSGPIPRADRSDFHVISCVCRRGDLYSYSTGPNGLLVGPDLWLPAA